MNYISGDRIEELTKGKIDTIDSIEFDWPPDPPFIYGRSLCKCQINDNHPAFSAIRRIIWEIVKDSQTQDREAKRAAEYREYLRLKRKFEEDLTNANHSKKTKENS